MKRLILLCSLGLSFNVLCQKSEYTFGIENVHSVVDAKNIGVTIKHVFIQPENGYTANILFVEKLHHFQVTSNRELTKGDLTVILAKDDLKLTSFEKKQIR